MTWISLDNPRKALVLLLLFLLLLILLLLLLQKWLITELGALQGLNSTNDAGPDTHLPTFLKTSFLCHDPHMQPFPVVTGVTSLLSHCQSS